MEFVAAGKSSLKYYMAPAPAISRLGVASVARQAACALAGNTDAWDFLMLPDQDEGESVRDDLKKTLLGELPCLAADGDELARLSTHIVRLIDERNMETLRQAADTIARSPEILCIEMWDRAALGSVSRACVIVLDRIHSALIEQGPDDDGWFLAPPRAPSATCAYCGLSFLEAPIPAGTKEPPYDPLAPIQPSSESAGSGELLAHLLKRSLVPPKDTRGWVLWGTMMPCGHLLHDHCSTKIFASRSDTSEALCCPVANCKRICSHVSQQWCYGESGTLFELGHGPLHEAKTDDAASDPRSQESLKGWIPEGQNEKKKSPAPTECGSSITSYSDEPSMPPAPEPAAAGASPESTADLVRERAANALAKMKPTKLHRKKADTEDATSEQLVALKNLNLDPSRENRAKMMTFMLAAKDQAALERPLRPELVYIFAAVADIDASTEANFEDARAKLTVAALDFAV